MNDTVKKIAVTALAAAAAGITGSVGTALGTLASDAIKSRLTPAPPPAPETKRRRAKR